jgi:signal transduction histidine kinase
VQESLANAARHAPGAPNRVRIEYLPDLVRVTVSNDPSDEAQPATSAARIDVGYGISGMQERAELVGARLTTGRLADGGWRNVLEIPSETKRSAS